MNKCSKCNVSVKQPYTMCYNCQTKCSTCKKKPVKEPFKKCFECHMNTPTKCKKCGADEIYQPGKTAKDSCKNCSRNSGLSALIHSLMCSTCKKKSVKEPFKNCYDCYMKSRNSCKNCGIDSIFMTGRSGRDVCFDCFISEEQDY